MTGRCFLATYRPLIHTGAGRRAVQEYGLPPFIDGSCRREPDFESPFPSITATCRAGGFAPRLRPGDTVAYLTVKGTYGGDTQPGWRMVAVLHVVERFETHDLAAEWYRSKGFALPSNCIVAGNPPEPLEVTNGNPPPEIKRRFSVTSRPKLAVRLWDRGYRQRVARWPVFFVCEATFLDVHAPPQISEADLVAVFDRVPGMLNPPAISSLQLSSLLDAVRRTA